MLAVDSGALTKVTDPSGWVLLSYGYGAVTGSDGARLPTVGVEGGVTYTFTYDAGHRRNGERSERTDNGSVIAQQTQQVHDANGNVVRRVDASGGVWLTDFDATDKAIARTDPLGRTYRLTYDNAGRQTRETAPDGSVRETRYDANGKPTHEIDALGRVSRTDYDPLGRAVRLIAPDGGVTEQGYDAAGRQVSVTDPLGRVTRYGYDAADRLIEETDPLGRVTRHRYDAVGNRVETEDPLGQVTRYEHDVLNRLVRSVLPDGSERRIEYDGAGRRIKETDGLGQSTQYAYDPAGRLSQVTDAQGGITSYSYDEVGNKTRQTDALGRITHWRYDNGGRVIEHRLPGGQSQRYEYDLAGRRLGHTDFNGQESRWRYDALDQVSQERRPDGLTVDYRYNAAGELTEVSDSRGVTRYTYDAAGRLLSRTDPDGSQLRYHYDAAGQLTELHTEAGGTSQRIQYHYDAAGNLTGLTDAQGGHTEWSYDALNRKTQQRSPNGQRTSWQYDALGRIVAQETEHGGPSQNPSQSRHTHQYDAGGRRTRSTEHENGQLVRQIDYRYDPLNRLIEESVSEGGHLTRDVWSYDAVGNRLGWGRYLDGAANPGSHASYTYDSNDRLTQQTPANSVGIVYSWNADGSLAKRTQGQQQWEYSWTKIGTESRLKQVRLLQSGIEQHRVSYTLDASGERIGRSALQAGSSPQHSHYLVDHNRPYSEALHELSNGQLQRSQLFAPGGVGELLQLTRAGQGTLYGESDAHGNLRILSDAQGRAVAQGRTDAWGGNASGTLNSVTPYGYTGEWTDPLTGLQYNRARWYDPSIGRWLSADPFAGLMTNPKSLHDYAYGENDAVNNVDPSGEFIGIIQIQFAGIRSAYKSGSGAKKAYDVFDSLRKNICKGATSLGRVAAQGHHLLPKFVGGREKQSLMDLDSAIHKALHSLLHIALVANNFPFSNRGRPAFEKYLKLNPTKRAERDEIIVHVAEFLDAVCTGVPNYKNIAPEVVKILKVAHIYDF